MTDLVVGVDAGGTATRCLVVSVRGEIIGSGSAAGANLRSSTAKPGDRLAQALTGALAGVDPARVRGGVFGVAGGGSAGFGLVPRPPTPRGGQPGLRAVRGW